MITDFSGKKKKKKKKKTGKKKRGQNSGDGEASKSKYSDYLKNLCQQIFFVTPKNQKKVLKTIKKKQSHWAIQYSH